MAKRNIGREIIAGIKEIKSHRCANTLRRTSRLRDSALPANARHKIVNGMTMIYWKGEKFWLGKIKEHPEIMTQGKTLKELEVYLKDAYRLMVTSDAPR